MRTKSVTLSNLFPGGEKTPFFSRLLANSALFFFSVLSLSETLGRGKATRALCKKREAAVRMLQFVPWQSELHWEVVKNEIKLQKISNQRTDPRAIALIASTAKVILARSKRRSDPLARFRYCYLLGYAAFFSQNYGESVKWFKEALEEKLSDKMLLIKMSEDGIAAALSIDDKAAAILFMSNIPANQRPKENWLPL